MDAISVILPIALIFALVFFALAVEYIAKDKTLNDVAEVMCEDMNHKEFHEAVREKKKELRAQIKAKDKRRFG